MKLKTALSTTFGLLMLSAAVMATAADMPVIGEKEKTLHSWKARDEWDRATPLERIQAATVCALVRLSTKNLWRCCKLPISQAIDQQLLPGLVQFKQSRV